MSFLSNTISFNNLAWYKRCPQAFFRKMNGEQGVLNETIANAAKFGIAAEQVWDMALSDNWFALTEGQARYKACFALATWDKKSSDKFMLKFNKCWSNLKDTIGTEYTCTLQPSYSIPVKDHHSADTYYITGKFDYLLTDLPESDTPVILECKSTSQKDSSDDFKMQVLHYCFMYNHFHKVIPKAYVFYTRLGAVVEYLFTKDELADYGQWLLTSLQDIIGRQLVIEEYDAKTGSYCFMCSYWKSCPTRQAEVRQGKESVLEQNYVKGLGLII